MTFVDLTKAFDTVSREGLWKIMAKFGCPAKFIAMVRQFHDGNLIWRICQCCSLKYFLPKIPKYHFVGICDETYQKVHGHYNLRGESGVYFKIMRKMFSLKPKDPFP